VKKYPNVYHFDPGSKGENQVPAGWQYQFICTEYRWIKHDKFLWKLPRTSRCMFVNHSIENKSLKSRMSGETLDSEQLRAEVVEVTEEIREFDARIEERARDRLRLIEKLDGLLPADQFENFKAVLTMSVEALKQKPDAEYLPDIEADEEDPIETLRKIRYQIAQEVCTVMGVETPKL
jgi:hypothetical protein